MKCLTMLGLACVVSASASKCRQLYCVEPSFERQQFSEAHPDVHAFIAEDMSSRAGAYLRKAIHYMQIGRTKVEEVERSGQDLGELAFGMAYQVAQHVSARCRPLQIDPWLVTRTPLLLSRYTQPSNWPRATARSGTRQP